MYKTFDLTDLEIGSTIKFGGQEFKVDSFVTNVSSSSASISIMGIAVSTASAPVVRSDGPSQEKICKIKRELEDSINEDKIKAGNIASVTEAKVYPDSYYDVYKGLINPGVGYRLIKVGEVLETGDEFYMHGNIWDQTGCVGEVLSKKAGVYRRKL